MLCNNKSLAKTSSTPGKTKLINQFKVNNNWYLVDLPGYGYARVSKTDKKQFDHIITNYIAHRQNLYCLFVLIDSRLPPQQIDVEFIHKCGELGLPIGLIFTKSDKDKGKPVAKNVETMKTELLKRWDELPPTFISSAIKGTGKTEILGYIENAIDLNSEI